MTERQFIPVRIAILTVSDSRSLEEDRSGDVLADRIEKVEKRVGEGRVKYVHPDCGFWMLKRSIADRKIAALAHGRDLYLGL